VIFFISGRGDHDECPEDRTEYKEGCARDADGDGGKTGVPVVDIEDMEEDLACLTWDEGYVSYKSSKSPLYAYLRTIARRRRLGCASSWNLCPCKPSVHPIGINSQHWGCQKKKKKKVARELTDNVTRLHHASKSSPTRSHYV